MSRPSQPVAIVDSAVRFLREKYSGPMVQAVDVGCGSGISTQNLYGKFQSVMGCDASPAMIEQAALRGLHGSIRFMVGRAESLPVEANSTQLVLIGRAIHYFDAEKFFREADRILVPGGVLCYYSVHFPTIFSGENRIAGEQINTIFWRYLSQKLADYWPVNPYNGHKVDENRRDYYVKVLHPPYPDTRVDETVSQERPIALLDLAREMETYSSFVALRAQLGNEQADQLLAEFLEECEEAAGITTTGGSSSSINLAARDSFFLVLTRKGEEPS